ncbi:MarR family transcriptional regulator [Micromonospora sp. DR5-3]|uniref:MarR family winged helix-turn-helix transcriptional regulator n=1 Tax=unclassified Micromonospora TaxID=2617518 RepID=UPI0011D69317|nr:MULTISPECIES: MarR family transcriptional regulator [unclassified Micromonospora]MCW3819379.1 MarR family transcriptional regulator [Micromonospora sp. DR5-3]TYC20860.1 MarR family transcriptional regulator [Micromonospora sp. MP36]
MSSEEGVARLGAVVGELHRLLRRSAAGRANREVLPEAQVELLLLVRAEPGISGKEAARRLGTAPNTVSTLVGDLADAGLLARERDPADRRVVRLRLTDAAQARMTDHAAHRSALLTEALAALDPAARNAVLGAVPQLDALLTHLRGTRDDDRPGGAQDHARTVK